MVERFKGVLSRSAFVVGPSGLFAGQQGGIGVGGDCTTIWGSVM